VLCAGACLRNAMGVGGVGGGDGGGGGVVVVLWWCLRYCGGVGIVTVVCFQPHNEVVLWSHTLTNSSVAVFDSTARDPIHCPRLPTRYVDVQYYCKTESALFDPLSSLKNAAYNLSLEWATFPTIGGLRGGSNGLPGGGTDRLARRSGSVPLGTVRSDGYDPSHTPQRVVRTAPTPIPTASRAAPPPPPPPPTSQPPKKERNKPERRKK
jgi:hypothetical protein